MKYIDIVDSNRVNRSPDKIIQVLSDGTIVEKGYKIKKLSTVIYKIREMDFELLLKQCFISKPVKKFV